MKVVVVSNCNTTAYYSYLTAMFPSWDVRSAVHTQAEEWVAEGHKPFRDFLGEVDMFVGMPSFLDKLDNDVLSAEATVIALPGFTYMATRPDCFWLPGITSPVNFGVIHSQIAASSFVAGKSESEAVALFNGEHFEAVGHFAQFDQSNQEVIDTYEGFGVSISSSLERWRGWGDFMYTPNHPDSRVLFDILKAALNNNGLGDGIDEAASNGFCDNFDDYMADGVVWPIYPEIADHFAIDSPKTRWRLPVKNSGGVEFDVAEMIRRSYALFAKAGLTSDQASAALGGDDNIALYAGAA